MEKPNQGIIKITLRMAVPAIVESFFVALAGLVDSFMVSSLGSDAVAAVGLTTQPKFLGLSVFFALNVSLSALVARRYGEKRQEDANRILSTALLITAVLSILLGILFVLFASPILTWCGSTPETHESAVTYYQIIMGGMFFNCMQMAINAIQRGSGNTQITMRTNVTSNTVNIIFNYLLIGGNFGFPALGIRGAALATVLGTVVAMVMSVISILNKNVFASIPYIIKNKIRPALSSFREMIKVGYGVFFEQLLMRIGFMATAIMAADQRMNAMAAHQVGMNLLGLSFAFGDGLQAAAVALIGRSLGEEKSDLAKLYASACQKVGGICSLVLALAYFLGARPLMSLYFREAEIVTIGVGIMYIAMIGVLFQIRQVIYTGSLRGAGDTLYTATVSAVSVTFIRTLASYVFGYLLGFGIFGIWFGIVADQMSRFIFVSVRFRQGKWTAIKI